MIVVVPEAHALPPEDIPGTDNTPYLAKNQQAVDEELFHDIIPFIETHYNISDEPRERAIAGLSMGGLQAIETESCIWAIFVGSVPSVLAFVLQRCLTSLKTR